MAAFDYSIRFRADDKISKVMLKMQKRLDNIQKAPRKATKAASKMSSKMVKGINATTKKLKEQQNSIGATAASFISMGYAILKPIRAAIEFEEAMAEVKKVVDGTPATFQKMEKEIFKMSKTIPLLPKELTEIAAAGGRLGIPADKLMGFSETVAKAAIAFDMSAEDAGNAFASLSNKMDIPIDKIGSVGDAINHLANTTATTAPAVVNIMGRLAGTMKQLKVPPELSAGISAFADQVFVSQELAASGVNQFVGALARTDKKFGLFTKLQKEGAAGFRDILGSMKKLDISKLTELFGVESARAIATMSGNLAVYDKTMAQVADKTKFAGSMQKEFDARSATTANAIKLLQNRLNIMFITMGRAFLPILNKVIKRLNPLIEQISDWAIKNKKIVAMIIKVSIVMAALVGGMLLFKLAITPLLMALNLLKMVLWAGKVATVAYKIAMVAFHAAMIAFRVVLIASTIAFKAFNLVMKMNPIGAVITAITAIVAAFAGFEYAVEAIQNKLREWFDWLKSKMGFLRDVLDAIGAVGDYFFGESDQELKATKEVNVTGEPLTASNKNTSEVTVKLAAKGIDIKEVQQRSKGANLNVGINTLGE